MAYRLVCDKCGAPIDPTSSRIVIGYNMDCWNEPEEKYELCVSCARRFKLWINSSFPIMVGKDKGGEDDNVLYNAEKML